MSEGAAESAAVVEGSGGARRGGRRGRGAVERVEGVSGGSSGRSRAASVETVELGEGELEGGAGEAALGLRELFEGDFSRWDRIAFEVARSKCTAKVAEADGFPPGMSALGARVPAAQARVLLESVERESRLFSDFDVSAAFAALGGEEADAREADAFLGLSQAWRRRLLRAMQRRNGFNPDTGEEEALETEAALGSLAGEGKAVKEGTAAALEAPSEDPNHAAWEPMVEEDGVWFTVSGVDDLESQILKARAAVLQAHVAMLGATASVRGHEGDEEEEDEEDEEDEEEEEEGGGEGGKREEGDGEDGEDGEEEEVDWVGVSPPPDPPVPNDAVVALADKLEKWQKKKSRGGGSEEMLTRGGVVFSPPPDTRFALGDVGGDERRLDGSGKSVFRKVDEETVVATSASDILFPPLEAPPSLVRTSRGRRKRSERAVPFDSGNYNYVVQGTTAGPGGIGLVDPSQAPQALQGALGIKPFTLQEEEEDEEEEEDDEEEEEEDDEEDD